MKHIASAILYFICLFLVSLRMWIKCQYGKITAEQILFFMYTNIDGTDKSLITSFVGFVIVIPLVLSFILVFLQRVLILKKIKINASYFGNLKTSLYNFVKAIAVNMKKYFSLIVVFAAMLLIIYTYIQTEKIKIEKSKFYKESADYTGATMEHYYTGYKNDILANPEYLIAHAGGALLKPEPYLFYTNSQEAVKNSLKNGFKYIELDIQQLADGSLVAFHDVVMFRNLTQDNLFKPGPLTRADFETKKIQGLYTPIGDMHFVKTMMIEHPDMVLVTDIINNYKALKEEFPDTSRLIVEAYNLDDYIRAKNKGFENVALNISYLKNLKDLEYIIKKGVNIITVGMPQLLDNEVVFRSLHEKGMTIFVWGDPIQIGRRENLRRFLGIFADMAYVDYDVNKNNYFILKGADK